MQLGLSLPFLTICLQFHSAPASQRFCGKHLSDTLSLVCGGRGFFWQEDKRTGYPVVAKRYTAGLQPGDEHHFKTRGIIQECCDNPCTLMDLENYCASDDKDSLGSTVDIAELFLGKPLVDGASTADGPVTIIGDHVTHNPQLLSRLQDLRARLRQSEASQSRLASRRPFFFVRPISRRPTRINVPPVGPSMVSPNPDLNRNSFVK